MLGRAVLEPDLVGQPVEQRVHPAHPCDLVILEGAFEVRQGPGIGDQDVARAQPVKAQQVHREGEDVVKRQGGQRHLAAFFHAFDQFHGLFHVQDQVGMGQHRPLGDTGGAAGVLQHRDIIAGDVLMVAADIGALGDARAPRGQCGGQADMGQIDALDRFVPVFLHQPHDATRHGGQEFGHAGDDDVGDRMGRCGARQLVGEHVHDDQRMRARIFELAGHFLGGIERVDIDQHAARLEHAEGGHREGQAVGHLHRHAVTRGKACHLAQIGGHGIGHGLDLRETQRSVHPVGQAAGEGRFAPIGCGDRSDHVCKVAIGGRGDLDTRASTIEGRPRPIRMLHEPPPHVTPMS